MFKMEQRDTRTVGVVFNLFFRHGHAKSHGWPATAVTFEPDSTRTLAASFVFVFSTYDDAHWAETKVVIYIQSN